MGFLDLPFFKRSSEMGQNAAPERNGRPEAVCESTVLYFQSVGTVKLDDSVQVPPPESSVLTRRRLEFPPFHFLAFPLGTAEVEEATGAPADPGSWRETKGMLGRWSGVAQPWRGRGGLPHLAWGCLASGAFSWRAAKFCPWPRRWWLSSCHPRVLL